MKIKSTTWLIALCILSAIAACKKQTLTPEVPTDLTGEIISVISAAKKSQLDSAVVTWIGCLPEQSAINEPIQMGGSTQEINGNYSCVVTPYQVAPGFNEVMVFSPSDVLDVGRWLVGSSIQGGSYQPVPIPSELFAPQTVSISIQTQEGTSSNTTIESPSHSGYVQAHNDLVSNTLSNATPAHVSYDIESIHEYDQVLSHIGASYGGWGAEIAGSYDFSSTSTSSRFLIKFIQKYYTIDLDIPSTASAWFTNDIPDYEELSQYCPTYISSIAYGRMVYMVIESSSTKEETQAALNASFNGWGNSFSFNWSQANNTNVDITNIKAFIVGGSSDFLSLQNMGDLSSVIESGAQFSPNSPGVPIAFTTRRLSDNGIVNFVTLSEYNVQECTLIGIPHTVNVPESQAHTICPTLIHGDDEFAGHGPHISGNISLVKKNGDTEIWAVVDALFNEQISDSDPDDTRAEIDPDDENYHIWLYTAPPGKQVLSIAQNPSTNFSYTDPDHYPDNVYYGTSSFVHDLIINGDTDGDDIECANDDDTFFRIWFKDFNITLTP